MAYNRVFAGVIGIVVLLSCKNDHSLSLYGLVTEADNGQAIANATVIFQTTRGKMESNSGCFWRMRGEICVGSSSDRNRFRFILRSTSYRSA